MGLVFTISISWNSCELTFTNPKSTIGFEQRTIGPTKFANT